MNAPAFAFRAAVVAALACMLAACASSPPRLVFDVGAVPGRAPGMWPAAPEMPRYLFAGALLGEQNFVSADAERRSAAVQALRWLAGIEEAGPDPVVLQRPVTGTVAADGRIFVSDASRAAVFVFDEAAGRLDVWDRADGSRRFVSPVGVAADADGGLLVADAELGYVSRLDAQGNPVGRIGQGTIRRPTGVVRDASSGRIFVADTEAHDIKVFSAQGTLLQVIGRRGEGEGEFNFPTHLAMHGGDLYVTDSMNSRVQIVEAETGRWRRAIGRRGLFIGNLVRPKGVAVDEEGNVYVVESYYDTLLVFDAAGSLLLPVNGGASAADRLYLPAGVWTDRRGRVFVADMFNGRVLIYNFLGSS